MTNDSNESCIAGLVD